MKDILQGVVWGTVVGIFVALLWIGIQAQSIDAHLAAIERSTARLYKIQETALAHQLYGTMRINPDWQLIPLAVMEKGIKGR
jgi:hypothetical protein